MGDRFKSFFESLILIVILLAIYWILGFLILKIFGKEIRNEKGYGDCVIGGFILKSALISILKHQ